MSHTSPSDYNVYNSSGTVNYRQFGLFDYDTVAPGDYDGDGKADFSL